MSQLIKAKIDVTKIIKALLFKGAKGTYLNIDIWISDKEDQFGNNVSIQQQTKKDEPKIYIGNGKVKDFVKKEADSGFVAKDEFSGSANKEAIVNKSKEQTDSKSDINLLPGANDELSDLPFN